MGKAINRLNKINAVCTKLLKKGRQDGFRFQKYPQHVVISTIVLKKKFDQAHVNK